MSASGKICKCYILGGVFVTCASTEFLVLHYLTQFCLKPCHKSYDLYSMTGKSDQSMIHTNAQLGTGNIGGSVCFWLIPKPDYFFLFLEIWEIINFINVKAEVFIKPFEGSKKKKKSWLLQ